MAEESTALQTQEKQEVERRNGAERIRATRCYVPRTDIYETDEEIFLVADMPGVDENSVDITLEKNVLTISGSVEFNAQDNYSLAFAEYEVGDYERSFTLSNAIDQNNIEAMVKNGVLRLRLPKTPESKSRKISVKAA